MTLTSSVLKYPVVLLFSACFAFGQQQPPKPPPNNLYYCRMSVGQFADGEGGPIRTPFGPSVVRFR